MWQEAKKQEKVLKGIMVDYKQRAERRKGFYDKIKKDPAEFLQLWGRQSKIHIDHNLAQAADNPSIMTKWRGDESTLIDRFDVRAHLDYLPDYKDTKNENLTESEREDECLLNYERYRTLVQNEAVGIRESQCLKQIEIDEKFGGTNLNKKEEKKDPKAQIGYTYQDSTPNYSNFNQFQANQKLMDADKEADKKDEEDLDAELDINKLTSEHKTILNKCAINYGMENGDYTRMLTLEDEEKEKIKMNKLLEAEKAQYSGRKSRRERRIVKERLRRERGDISPLSYVIQKTPEKESSSSHSRSRSRSQSSSSSRGPPRRKTRFRSRSPSQYASKKNKIIMITSFGGDDDEVEPSVTKKTVKLSPNEKEKSKIENTLLSLKRLKQNVTSMRSSQSRSRSKSPVPKTNSRPVAFRKSYSTSKSVNNDSTTKKTSNSTSSDSSSSTSDEEEALKNYMKRREDRKQNEEEISQHSIKKSNETKSKETEQTTAVILPANNNSEGFAVNNTSLNFDVISTLNGGNNKTSADNGGLSTKFRSAEEFKHYQEKLKKKMQKQIDKQLKKDKVIEKVKRKKEREERREREAELNSISEKMRLRIQAERKKNGYSSSDDSVRSDHRSASRDRGRSRSRSRDRRRSIDRTRRRSRERSIDRTRRRSKERSNSSINRRRRSRERSNSSNNRRRSRSIRSHSGSRSSRRSYRRTSRSRSRSRKRFSPRRRSRSRSLNRPSISRSVVSKVTRTDRSRSTRSRSRSRPMNKTSNIKKRSSSSSSSSSSSTTCSSSASKSSSSSSSSSN